MPEISQLYIYPIKSCAAVAVNSLEFDEAGPLGDRRFMLVDDNGRFLTQRTLPAMAHIYPRLEGDKLLVDADGKATLEVSPDRGARVDVIVWKDEAEAADCGDEAAAWFSSLLGKSCRLVRLTEDTQRQIKLKYAREGEYVSFADGYPLLITTQASLDALSEKLGRPLDMLRFRPNVVLTGTDAFAELKWQRLELSGTGTIEITKPCERCVIPTRDIETQQRQADVLTLLKEECTIDGKIIFGQNALTRGVRSLTVGQVLSAVSE